MPRKSSPRDNDPILVRKLRKGTFCLVIKRDAAFQGSYRHPSVLRRGLIHPCR